MKKVTLTKTLGKLLLICMFILFIGDEGCDICYTTNVMAVRGMLCGIVIIFITLWDTKKYKQFENMAFTIANQPLLETNEATDTVSFAAEGTVECPNPITSHFTQTPCVYYHTLIETIKRGQKNWHIEKQIVESTPFYIQDERGKLRIDPSTIDHDTSGHDALRKEHKHEANKHSRITVETLIKQEVYKQGGKRYRKSEYVLKPGTKIFAYGYVKKQDNELTLTEHTNHPLIISTKSQKEFIKIFFKGKHLIYFAPILLIIGFCALVLSPIPFQLLPEALHISIATVGSTFIAISIIFIAYNRIITLKNRMNNAKANIESELKRRNSLIPRLVETVKGFVQHEQTIQNLITTLRSKATASYTNIHDQIAIIAESYPNLKASEHYQTLMTNLTDTEERIAYSRNFYNNSVQQYNTKIQQFPVSIIASLTKHKPQSFITINNAS